MRIAELLLVALSACVMLAYICRLSMISLRTTTPMIVILHLALALANVWSGYRAWIGDSDLGEICSVIAALAWIVVSYRTWQNGVPEHFSKPMELDPLEWGKVVGRGDR